MNFETIKLYYEKEIWTDAQVKIARDKGVITKEQCEEILKSKEKRQKWNYQMCLRKSCSAKYLEKISTIRFLTKTGDIYVPNTKETVNLKSLKQQVLLHFILLTMKLNYQGTWSYNKIWKEIKTTKEQIKLYGIHGFS